MENIKRLENHNCEEDKQIKKDKFSKVFDFEADFETISSVSTVPTSLQSTKHRHIFNKITGNVILDSKKPNYLPKQFVEIDPALITKFYNTIVQMRLKNPTSTVNSSKTLKIGQLLEGFMLKYANPVSEEVTPDMILQYVKEVQLRTK